MYMWMHSNRALVGCMDDRFCIIMKVECACSGEASNSFKVIRVGSNEVLARVEWEERVIVCAVLPVSGGATGHL